MVPKVLLSCSRGGRTSPGHAGLFLLPLVRQEQPWQPAGPDSGKANFGEFTAAR